MTAPPTLQRDNRPPPPEASARLQISLTQVVAAALAAISATVVASFFGVTGTVIGAAISSVFSVVGTAVYGHSLRRTRDRMREVVPATIRRVPRPPNFPPPPGAWLRPGARPTFPQPHGSTALGYGPVRYSQPRRATRRRSLALRLAFGSAALFVAILAAVTGVEALAQRPLSDLVRGNDAVSGTTLFGNHSQASRHGTHAPVHRLGRPGGRHSGTSTGTATPSSPAATSSASPRPSQTSSSSPASSPSASSHPSGSTSTPASPPAADRTGGTAPLG